MGQQGGTVPGPEGWGQSQQECGAQASLLFLEKRHWLWGRKERRDGSSIVKGFNELCPMYSKGA